MINTNWTLQGPVSEPGLRVDLRYEYMDQDQPMQGSHKVGVGEVPQHHDEVYTVNRNWFGIFDYTFDPYWGVNVSAPFLDRDHYHIHNHHGEQVDEKWDYNEWGDIRVVGRRQWILEGEGSVGFAGLTFGVKLPTGDFDVKNSEGEEAERSLQPGTGTTDLILGAYYSHVAAEHGLSWFAQVHESQRPRYPAPGARRRRAGSVAGGRAALADVQDGGGVEDRVPLAPGIPHPAHGVVRAAPVADPGARQRRQPGSERGPSRCALAAHPGALPRQPADRRRRSLRHRRTGTHAGHAGLLPSPATRGSRGCARPGTCGAERRGSRRDAPVPGHRQLRRPLRDPLRAPRRGGERLCAARRLRVLVRQRLRQRGNHLHAVRGPDGPAQDSYP